MRRTLFALLAVSALAAAAPAFAQTIDERQNSLFRRIEEGVANGALTRDEANRLRNDFYGIARLENDYRRDGFLSQNERRDLNQRFDNLSRQIDRERRDPERGGEAIYDRARRLEQNIRDGERGGGLTRQEADRLWGEMDNFNRMLADYRRSGDGLDGREREALNRRLDQLAQRILNERRDGQEQGRYDDRRYDDRRYDDGRYYDNRRY